MQMQWTVRLQVKDRRTERALQQSQLQHCPAGGNWQEKRPKTSAGGKGETMEQTQEYWSER